MRAGERTAFDQFVDRYFGMVFTLALARLRNHEDAEDLAQEAFLRAFLHLDRLRQPRYLSTWLSQITRNLARDWAKGADRRTRLIDNIPLEEVGEKAAAEGVRDKMETQQRQQLIDEAMGDLSVEERELVLLHYTEELSKKEIAALLGIHPSTVGRHLDRALSKVRDHVLGELKAVRPSSTARKRTATALAAAAALSTTERAALAAGVPATAIPVSGSLLGQLPILATAIIFLLGGIIVFQQKTANPPDTETAQAIQEINQRAAEIDSYVVDFVYTALTDGNENVIRQSGVFLDEQHFTIDRLHMSPDDPTQPLLRCRIVGNEDGVLLDIFSGPGMPIAASEFFASEDIARDGLRGDLQLRPRLDDPFGDIQSTTLELLYRNESEIAFSGMTHPFQGKAYPVELIFDTESKILKMVSAMVPGSPEPLVSEVIDYTINPPLNRSHFVLRNQ